MSCHDRFRTGYLQLMKIISDTAVRAHLLDSLSRESILSEYQHVLLNILDEFEKRPEIAPERTVQVSSTSDSDTTHLFMPCIASHNVGVKVISGGPTNSRKGLGFQGSVMIIDEYTGELQAVINAKSLTAFRTALASSVGLVRFLDSESGILPELSVFGAGPQAFWHVVVACRLYPQITRVNVISRSKDSADFLASELSLVLDVEIHAIALGDTRSVKQHGQNSSIIYGCTPSTEGIIGEEFINSDPSKRKFISLIGSYKPHMVELDLKFISDHYTHKNVLMVVDLPEHVLREAGEVIQGAVPVSSLVLLARLKEANLGDFVTSTGVVVQKLVGLLVMDIAVGRFLMSKVTGETVDDF